MGYIVSINRGKGFQPRLMGVFRNSEAARRYAVAMFERHPANVGKPLPAATETGGWEILEMETVA